MAPKNVLIIAIDDLNAWATSKQLYPGVMHTPNLDRLMAEGTTFVNAHAQIAVCNPSRASVWTGEQPADTGIHNNAPPPWVVMDPAQTLHAQLRHAGYETVGAGKIYHFAGPAGVVNALFDHYVDAGAEPTAPGVYPGPMEDLRDCRDTEAIVGFLDAHAAHGDDGAAGTPFFATLGLRRPHVVWAAPQEFFDLYAPGEVTLPHTVLDDLADVPQAAITETDLAFARPAPAVLLNSIRNYLAAASFTDAMIGHVLDALDRNGLTGQTAIIVWSDNAHHLGEKDLVYKHTLWDEATRVPLIIVDPDLGTPGGTVAHPVELLDLYPTVLELIGMQAATPARLDGESLVPLMRGLDPEAGDAAFSSVYGSFSMRTEDWRYSRYFDGSEELYDLRTDAHEDRNVAGLPANWGIKTELAARLDAWKAEHRIVHAAVGQRVDGSEGNDTLINADTSATLVGGGGDDVYILAKGSKPTIVEAAKGGTDTVYYDGTYTLPANIERAFARDNRMSTDLTGNAAANLIAGAVYVADTLRGAGGDDVVYAYSGNDKVYAGPGNDTVYAGAGDDVVFGNEGDDSLGGEGDNDRLNGGPGRDTLTGGTGNDVFVYEAVVDSPAGTDRDMIVGFDAVGWAPGDRIALQWIDARADLDGDQAFVFIGTAPFYGPGEVRVMDSGTNTVVQINIDADPAPEMEIQVNDGAATAAQWCAGDFAL